MNSQIEESYKEDYAHIDNTLFSISSFLDKHRTFNYGEFDYYVSHELTLFFIEPDFDFLKLQKMLGEIKKVLPACKRIFSKPIIALKDNREVLPVELVSKTSQDTLFHLGNHFNDVSNIKNGHIKPRKLLTEIYEDDYGIYENIIFCNFIDMVLSYAKRNIKTLRNLLYASEIMEFNLLERVNHIDYYLALGKLHTGYVRNFHKYFDEAKALYNDSLNIINTITPRLKKRIYTYNKKNKKKLKLKKTNIFINQKDYRAVYLTYKDFIKNKIEEDKKEVEVDLTSLQEKYYSFTKILTLFSISHFGFSLPLTTLININKLNLNFFFKKWKLNIKTVENKAIKLTISKDTTYTVIIYPSVDRDEQEFAFKKDYQEDLFIVASPHEDEEEHLFLSIENIDSFRRIQQLILKGMIYSDTSREDCPFCDSKLSYDKKKKCYYCEDCGTEIYSSKCKHSKKEYYYTSIRDYKLAKISKEESLFYDRKLEAIMNFRNITKVNSNGEIYCPICNEIEH